MKKVFTTGQVAQICKVAPRTVVKWFDSGRLRGYRIPGHQDRRIPREHLLRFLNEHVMPLGELEGDPGAAGGAIPNFEAPTCGEFAAPTQDVHAAAVTPEFEPPSFGERDVL